MSANINYGADIAIRAWKDDEFKENILNVMKSNETIENAFDIKLGDTQLCIVENSESVHNLIVCTLCSCYPRRILGIPPDWYKSIKYRTLCVEQPRQLLKQEFDLDLPNDISLRVHDSTSELRYMVLPHLPSQVPNWENMSHDELKSYLTRDMLIGVTR